jgi:hypothetical protein
MCKDSPRAQWTEFSSTHAKPEVIPAMSALLERGQGSAMYECNALIGRSEVQVFLHERRELVEVLQH